MSMFNKIWFVTSDCCGIVCANLSIFILIFAQYTMIKVILLPWYGFGLHCVLYTLFTCLAVVSHQLAQYSNPGTVPRNLKPKMDYHHDTESGESRPLVRENTKLCGRCNSVKPGKAHHCRTCARCIVKMDHHCPWVNNCIGIFNQKYFLLFLLYTFVVSLYAGVLLISRFFSCTSMPPRLSPCMYMTHTDIILSMICMMCSLVFGLFVLVMFCDQMGAIMSNTSAIDKLQKKAGERRSRLENIRSVFGESFSYRWLLPLAVSQKILEEFTDLVREYAELEDDHKDLHFA